MHKEKKKASETLKRLKQPRVTTTQAGAVSVDMPVTTPNAFGSPILLGSPRPRVSPQQPGFTGSETAVLEDFSTIELPPVPEWGMCLSPEQKTEFGRAAHAFRHSASRHIDHIDSIKDKE